MMESISARVPAPAMLRSWPMLRLARKGVLALSIKLAGAGVALALQVALARSLGHAGYGEFTYVFAWLQLILVLAHGGFATAALRYVAEYRARCQPALVRGFLTRSSQIALLESVGLAVLMAGCAVALHHRSDSTGSARNFLIASIALPFLSQGMLGSAFVRGLGHVILSMLVNLTQPLLLLGGLVTVAYLFGIQISSSGALVLNFCAAVGALGMVIALRRHLERGLDWGQQRTFRTGEWLGTATRMMIASLLAYFQGRTGVIITGMLLGTGEAGTYAAMERLADVALLGLISINFLAAPKFAALYAQGRRRDLQRYACLAAWGSTGFMLATVVPLVLFGKPIVRTFGEEFVSGYAILPILIGGIAVNAMCGANGFLLSMTGHERETIVVALFSLCLNLTLSFLLIPRYGIIGTSVANALTMIVWNLATLLIVRWRLGMWSCIGRFQ